MVAPEQSSLAVGAVNVGVAVHSIVASTPAFPITGACVSVCVMTCVLVVLSLLHASTASQVLVIVLIHPFTTVTSLSWFTVAPEQSSLAVGAVNVGVAVHSDRKSVV